MRLSPVLPLVLSLSALLGASVAHGQAKVEELVVGPANAGGIYVTSPRGGHIAFAGTKGIKAYVSVDGVDGPLVDELFTPTGQSFYNPAQMGVHAWLSGGGNTSSVMPVILSEDGEHYAYAARIGNEYIVIHDGKEIARGPRTALSLNYGALTLSPTGRHVFWDEMKMENSNGSWRLMMSGKPGPWSGHQTMTPSFSGDDVRFAYNAGKIGNYQDQILVIDGKEAGYAGLKPMFTADGKSVITMRAIPNVAVFVDGKPAIEGLSIDKIIVAPAGKNWGAIVRTKLVNNMGVGTFFLNGKAVDGTDGAQSAVFSPDGKHYAVICQNAASRSSFLVADGKAGPEFGGISDQLIRWTPDGSKVIYTATASGRNFVVVNHEPVAVNALMGLNPIVLPKEGSKYSYGTYDGTNRIFSLIVDGQSVLLPGVYPYGDTITLSPDGSRYAYFFGPIGRSELTGIAIDGKAAEGLSPLYFAKWRPTDAITPSVIFSPDSKHVAHLGRTAKPDDQGLYVDGQLAYATKRTPFYPTFSPDSKHLYWATTQTADGKPLYTVFADGREVVKANAQAFSSTAGNWTMSDKGVLTVFATDGDAVKRYRVSAPSDSSIDSMVSDLTKARALAAATAEAERQAAATAAAQLKAEKEAAAAKAQADAAAAVAAKAKARQEAAEAKKQAAAEAAAAKAKAREDAANAKKAK